MRLRILSPGTKLQKTQRTALRDRIILSLARYGASIDQVIVRLSAADKGYTRCRLEAHMKGETVTAEDTDTSAALAVGHAAARAARSVARVIQNQARSLWA